MKRLLLSALGTLALAACADAGKSTAPSDEASAPAAPAASANLKSSEAGSRLYEVTITNLTNTQPLSPGVVVTHTKDVEVWAVGNAASEGIRQIAENGDELPAVGELTGAPGIFEVVGIGLPPIHRVGGLGGTAQTFRIAARGNANRLSVAVMLICTNDGFTGVSGVKLPGGFKPEEFLANGYDAGTEANDQLYTHVVDPCGAIGPAAVAPDGQNLRTATPSGVIAPHPGIQPVGDFTAAVCGWSDPVARITIQRVK